MQAASNGLQQHFPLVDKDKGSEDAEDAQEAYAPQHEHIACPRQYDCKIWWERGYQVDNAPEGEGIAAAALGTVEPDKVFHREDHGERTLQPFQYQLEQRRQHGQTLHKEDEQADGNGGDDDNVKSTCGAIVAKEDGSQLFFLCPGGAVHRCLIDKVKVSDHKSTTIPEICIIK